MVIFHAAKDDVEIDQPEKHYLEQLFFEALILTA